MRSSFLALATIVALFLTGCATTSRRPIDSAARAQMLTEIANEPPGNYFIARRYYKKEYKFWGYVRKPGEQWSTAKMVILNEHQKLAPDRASGTLGNDIGYEYRLFGHYSGDTVYEPASNAFYPEFVLTGYELRHKTPGPIFSDPAAALDPERRVIMTPF